MRWLLTNKKCFYVSKKSFTSIMVRNRIKWHTNDDKIHKHVTSSNTNTVSKKNRLFKYSSVLKWQPKIGEIEIVYSCYVSRNVVTCSVGTVINIHQDAVTRKTIAWMIQCPCMLVCNDPVPTPKHGCCNPEP